MDFAKNILPPIDSRLLVMSVAPPSTTASPSPPSPSLPSSPAPTLEWVTPPPTTAAAPPSAALPLFAITRQTLPLSKDARRPLHLPLQHRHHPRRLHLHHHHLQQLRRRLPLHHHRECLTKKAGISACIVASIIITEDTFTVGFVISNKHLHFSCNPKNDWDD